MTTPAFQSAHQANSSTFKPAVGSNSVGLIPSQYGHKWRRLGVLIGLISLLLFTLSLHTQASEAYPEHVGQVTMALGQANVTRSQSGKHLSLKTGMVIYTGDIIETRAGGHLHLRFIDNALISMKPGSRMTVDTYDYNPRQPEKGAVRFTLQEGIARSVSGSAAKLDNSRFRLNTPIAAIGVRGTDFTVSATQDVVRTFVSEGAIVVSPFSETCASAALGPCSVGGVELKGGSNQLVELNEWSVQPKLLRLALNQSPTSNLLLNERLIARISQQMDQNDRLVASSGTQAQSVAPEDLTPDSGSDTITVASIETDNRADNGVDGSAVDDSAVESTTLLQTSSTTQTASVEGQSDNQVSINLIDFIAASDSVSTPTNTLSAKDTSESSDLGIDSAVDLSGVLSKPDISKGMIWSYTPSDTFTAPDFMYTDTRVASATTGIHPVFLANGFTLYRPDSVNDTINPSMGSVSFDLQSASVFYYDGIKQVDMAVNASHLELDFASGRFDTGLEISHENTGTVLINTSGELLSNGRFSAFQPGLALEGASALDGQAAGYYFQKDLSSLKNDISGITVWQKYAE